VSTIIEAADDQFILGNRDSLFMFFDFGLKDGGKKK